MAVDREIPAERVPELETNEMGCENIWLKIYDYHVEKKALFVGLYYFPPNTSPLAYRRVNENIIELVLRGKDVLILGDFNVSNFESSMQVREGCASDRRLVELIELLNITGLSSCNTVRNHLGRTLDIVLSNVSAMVEQGASLTSYPDAYHPPLEIILGKRHPRAKTKNSVISNCELQESETFPVPRNFAGADFFAMYKGMRIHLRIFLRTNQTNRARTNTPNRTGRTKIWRVCCVRLARGVPICLEVFVASSRQLSAD